MTGIDAWRAASCADSNVPLSSPDRWIDKTAVAPFDASRSYVSRNTAGVGRDVLTGSHSRSACAMVAGVAWSVPSSYDVAPITTCNGTTAMPRSRAVATGNEAVESVTMATDMSEGYRSVRCATARCATTTRGVHLGRGAADDVAPQTTRGIAHARSHRWRTRTGRPAPGTAA